MAGGNNESTQQAGGKIAFGMKTGGGAINIGGNVGNGDISQGHSGSATGGSGGLDVDMGGALNGMMPGAGAAPAGLL